MGDRLKIDEIDAKIIKILLLESRTSLTAIAHECKITVTAVRTRYKRLWRDGIINGEKMLVNPHCLGYRHIVDLGITAAVENEKEVAKFLESKPYISEVVGPTCKFNFYGKVALKDLNSLHGIIEDLESNSKIKHVDAFIWAEAVNIEFPQNLMVRPLEPEKGQKNYKTVLTKHEQATCDIDEVDRKIAKILSENSRTPFKTIAQKLDISTKTVVQRYKKLRESLLSRSTITVDLNKLGYKALANLYLKISNRSKMSEIYSKLLEIPNLIVIIRLIDNYDLYCALVIDDFERLFESNEKIRRIIGVEEIEVILVPAPSSWPFNLFPSLIDSEFMQPKYWRSYAPDY